MTKKAVLIVGSPKKENSTSNSLGSYLLKKLIEKGFETEKHFVSDTNLNNEDFDNIMKNMNQTDILIISFPLYVDCMPSHLINFLEKTAGYRKNNISEKKTAMLGICNCGFPEASQNQTALDILKLFAQENSFIWLGGLALGQGGSISGKSLDLLGGMVRNIVKSINITAEALANNQNIPEEAVSFMAKSIVPRKLYCLLGHLEWKKMAKHYGTHKNLKNQPYKKFK